MNPSEIIAERIRQIPGIRIPLVRIITENILQDLKDEGFVIVEERDLRRLPKIGS